MQIVASRGLTQGRTLLIGVNTVFVVSITGNSSSLCHNLLKVIRASGELFNDFVMMLSEDGRLLKLINTSRGRHQLLPVVVDVLQVFSQPVVHIHIHGPSSSRRQSRYSGRDDANEGRDNAVEAKEKVLVVASRVDVVQLPLQRCNTQTSCRQAGVFIGLPSCHFRHHSINHTCLNSDFFTQSTYILISR